MGVTVATTFWEMSCGDTTRGPLFRLEGPLEAAVFGCRTTKLVVPEEVARPDLFGIVGMIAVAFVCCTTGTGRTSIMELSFEDCDISVIACWFPEPVLFAIACIAGALRANTGSSDRDLLCAIL